MFLISCEKAEELLSPFLDGEVTMEEAASVVGHLKGCPSCSTLCEELRQGKQLCAGLPKITPKRDLWSRIARHRDHTVVRLSGAVPQSASWLRWGGLVASFAILFFFLVTLVGYFTPGDLGENGQDDVVQLHAFHCERQPLNDRTVWAFLSGAGNETADSWKVDGD